jgi:hypothetical protein
MKKRSTISEEENLSTRYLVLVYLLPWLLAATTLATCTAISPSTSLKVLVNIAALSELMELGMLCFGKIYLRNTCANWILVISFLHGMNLAALVNRHVKTRIV